MKIRRLGNVRIADLDHGTQVGVAWIASAAAVKVARAPVAPPYKCRQKRDAVRTAIKALREGLRHARQ